MNKPQPTRRQILQLSGSGAIMGLAGCTDLLSEDEQSGTDPTNTTDDHDEEEASHDDGHNEEEGGHDDGHDEEESGHDDAEGEDEHGHNHDEGSPEEPSATAEVSLQTEGDQHHFAPHMVWVEPGGTVTWVSESGQHDAVAYHPDNGDKPLRIPEGAESWDSGLLTEAGETFSHTFETEGVYDYFCTPHEAVGMVGTVIVGEPDAHGQPALEEPQESLPDGARTELEDLGQSVNEALGHTH
ncbi:cupredoxin domain-containing protein [Halovenus sp. HT40]|uniref:cupredoxin domain-containing protein n=1 Tax=Halovenus sp. HT40 TaxID=3126691 RepID=UPI00300F263B